MFVQCLCIHVLIRVSTNIFLSKLSSSNQLLDPRLLLLYRDRRTTTLHEYKTIRGAPNKNHLRRFPRIRENVCRQNLYSFLDKKRWTCRKYLEQMERKTNITKLKEFKRVRICIKTYMNTHFTLYLLVEQFIFTSYLPLSKTKTFTMRVNNHHEATYK